MDKPWWKSKTMWAAILYFVLTIVKANGWLEAIGVTIPWEAVTAGLASLGLWGLRDAQGAVIVAAAGGKKRK